MWMKAERKKKTLLAEYTERESKPPKQKREIILTFDTHANNNSFPKGRER